MGSYCVVTLVMDGDRYIPGAIALAKSVKLYMPEIATVCMITDDVPTSDLAPHFDEIVEVDRIYASNTPKVGGSKASIVYTWNSYSATKWNILGLDPQKYEKVLFMDADMILLTSISELFELPVPAAVFDHQLAQEYVADARWLGDRSGGKGFINHYKDMLGMGIDDHLESGIPIPRDAIERLRTHASNQFAIQGGMVLVTPSLSLLDEFKRSLDPIIDSLGCTRTLSAIDEISITLFFHDIGYTWTSIDIKYNVAAYHTYPIFENDASVLHFISTYKPWSMRPDGRSEREYVRNAASNPSRHRGYVSHHKCVEMWWQVYESS